MYFFCCFEVFEFEWWKTDRQIDRQMDGQTGQQTGRQTGCERFSVCGGQTGWEWKTVGSVERMFLVHTIKLIVEQEIKEPSRCQWHSPVLSAPRWVCMQEFKHKQVITGRVGHSTNTLTDRQAYDLWMALERLVHTPILLVSVWARSLNVHTGPI